MIRKTICDLIKIGKNSVDLVFKIQKLESKVEAADAQSRARDAVLGKSLNNVEVMSEKSLAIQSRHPQLTSFITYATCCSWCIATGFMICDVVQGPSGRKLAVVLDSIRGGRDRNELEGELKLISNDNTKMVAKIDILMEQNRKMAKEIKSLRKEKDGLENKIIAYEKQLQAETFFQCLWRKRS